MDYSLRNILITATVSLLFITCILNFIVLFPEEQGVTFDDTQSQNGYLTIQNNTDLGTQNQLSSIENQTTGAFNDWDVTQGFMGSNTIKQGQTSVGGTITQVFTSLRIIAVELFTSNSPIIYAIGIFTTLAGIILIYAVYSFVRTGK